MVDAGFRRIPAFFCGESLVLHRKFRMFSREHRRKNETRALRRTADRLDTDLRIDLLA